MTQNDALQPTKEERSFAASQWIADAVAWSRKFPGEGWRKFPVRGLLGSLGSSYQNCDCEGVAGAVLALCESGDPRYPDFARPDFAALLVSAQAEIVRLRTIDEANLGEDTTHARLVCLVGALCCALEPQIHTDEAVNDTDFICVQLIAAAWYLNAISGQ